MKYVSSLLSVCALAVVMLFGASAYAQSIGAGPGCTITADPIVVTSQGGKVNLVYETSNHPKTVTISASDSAAKPASKPTLSAPDPDFANDLQTGEIMSGPVTKNTTFTMHVANSKGTSECTVSVYYTPRPKTGWEVPLVKQESVFSRLDIPGGFDTTFGDWPFHTVYWIPGDYFVVNGAGNSTAGVGTAEALLKGKQPSKFESGGMYGFSADGTFLGARDVIYDSSRRAVACFEGGGCTAYDGITPLAPGKFVRDLDNVTRNLFGFARGPITYTLSSSGFTMDARLFYNELGWSNDNLSQQNALRAFGEVAVAGNKIIGVALRNGSGGSRDYAYTNEVYDTNFNKLATFSKAPPVCTRACSGTPPQTVPLFFPVVGVGEYVIGIPSVVGYTGGGFGPYTVYKMPSLDELTRGIAPKSTGTILEDRVVFWTARDTANANRVGLLSIPKGKASGSVAPTLSIFEAGTSTLIKVSERELDAYAKTASGNGSSAFALSGDYVAYGACPKGTTLGWDGERGGYRWDNCQLVVEKVSGGRLSVEPLPRSKYSDYGTGYGLGALLGDSQAIGGVAISPTGRIMVTTGAGPNSGGGDNGNIYVYQIGGAQTTPPGGPGGPIIPGGGPQPGTGLPIGTTMDNLNLAKGYLLLLQALFTSNEKTTTIGGGATQKTTSTGTSTSQYQSIFDAAIQLINGN